MKDSDFHTLIDRVKAANPIEGLVSERVELERAGNRRRGRCCFHTEKTGSLVVYPQNDSWYCYGECARGGDAIEFVKLAEQLTTWEAVLYLARRGNVPLPEPTPEQRAQYQERRVLGDILDATTRFYETERTDEVVGYLRNVRGLTDETIERWRIGFAPGGGALKKHLLGKGYSLEDCYKAGVLKFKPEGSERSEGSAKGYPVDYFYNRIIIPNVRQGRVVNLYGRAFGDGHPKYLGLPLEKEHLFNEDACRASDPLFVEGLFDAIISEQYGYQAVAAAGTAFKDEDAAKFGRCEVWALRSRVRVPRLR